MKQRFTSKQTSINSTKVPAVYSMKRAVDVMTGKTVVDIGGGRFDTAAEAARVYGAARRHESRRSPGLECCPVWSFDSSNTEKINFYLKSIDK